MSEKTVTISTKTIWHILAIGFGVWLAWRLQNILILFFIGFIIMSTLYPLVEWLHRYKIPKVVSIIFIPTTVILSISLLIYIGITPLINEFPLMLDSVIEATEGFIIPDFINPQLIEGYIGSYSEEALTLALGFFQNILALITVIISAIYFMLEREKIYDFLSKAFGNNGKKTSELLHKIEIKLGAWLRGQILASLFVSVLYYGVLRVSGVEYAFPIAVLGALFEFIPMVGPFLAAIPAILLGLTISPITALGIAIAYLIIQQIESYIVIPRLMNKAVGMSPLLIIFSLSAGGILLGFMGVLLAIPLAAVIQILVTEKLDYKSK